MNRITNYCRLIGLAAILGLSNAAYADCLFESEGLPDGFTAPDRVSDLSGQGNVSCTDIVGSDGMPMREVTEVVFTRNNGTGTFTWELLEDDWDTNENGFVKNTPDDILAFPQGNGTRCDFSFLRNNAVKGTLLDIGGNIDTQDSIACTDDTVNNEEAPPPPEPDIVLTGDNCAVTVLEGTDNITSNFDVITATNIMGDKNAICSANPLVGQNECVRGCPEFKDIDAAQNNNRCLPDPTNDLVPLTDPNTEERCTPCLTAVEAKMADPRFDTGFAEDGTTPLRLCWEWVNRVNEDDVLNLEVPPGFYKPHKQVRDQTTQTVLYNECYTTTTTINFFGREITKTVTTCD